VQGWTCKHFQRHVSDANLDPGIGYGLQGSVSSRLSVSECLLSIVERKCKTYRVSLLNHAASVGTVILLPWCEKDPPFLFYRTTRAPRLIIYSIIIRIMASSSIFGFSTSLLGIQRVVEEYGDVVKLGTARYEA